MMEGKGAAAAWMPLLLASLLLLALSPSPTDGFDQPTELSSSNERRRLDSTRIRRDVWLPVELQQLAEDEIRHEARRVRRKHKRRSQHNSPEEEERRRRLWEQQERRRVDEERRRAHEPPRPEEPPQPTTRRPTYEERLREWQRQKEEHDRLVREREKEYEALTVRPLGPPVSQSAPSNVQRAPPGSLTDDEAENERKLQDYIERNTPINAPGRGQLMAHSRPPASRQPWPAGQRDPYESHEQRGYPAYNYNEPERSRHHEGGSGEQQQLTPEDERQIAEYHERLEMQLAQLQGPARQEFERQARQREDEYRRRLQQDHLREKTGCNQTSSDHSGVKGQAQRRPPPASSIKGAVVDPCASGPYPPYGDARYANRGPDGRPCPPPHQSRGETKGPSNDRDPYEQYRRTQESRYRPEQSKGPEPDNRYEEQVRAAEARWRAEQNKGPVVDPYAELRRAEEARYLAQRNKGPAPAPYEESRRAQEEARYRAEQNKGVVTPPPAGRYGDEQSEPDWRRYEEMRRAEDATRIQPAASKGSSSNGRPNDDGQETLQPEVWNRVYQASYHRAGGDPAESSSSSHSGRDSGREQQEPTRPQRPQSAGAPSSRYGSHPAAAAAARPNHSDVDGDDDQAGSTSNVSAV
ncbi:glutactin-like isoform X2 [Trichogramma pretiosum]|uniref:glutactin-like isoform X2 n=1 Tax=Trichogramma pretiosum TaxID=7493 RepID=UPI000C718BAF|nr:glutactin-like isoform X2 [Trichogramma pretiosum]